MARHGRADPASELGLDQHTVEERGPPFLGARPGSQSIERQFPLVISGLLLVTVTVFAWAAYQRVRHVALMTAAQRLKSASFAMDGLFAQSMERYAASLTSTASDPALARFLQTGEGRDAAREVLGSVVVRDPSQRGRVELRRPDGTIVLDTVFGATPSSDWAAHLVAGIGRPRIGPLLGVNDSTYFQAQAVVVEFAPDRGGAALHAATVLGYVTDLRLLSGQNVQAVRDLIGADAIMLVGSPTERVWTDLDHRRPAPLATTSVGTPMTVRDPFGNAAIGLLTNVPGTPWAIWIDQPVASALAPVQPLLIELVTLAALIIGAGTAIAWVMSRRITAPIVALTAAAERIAATYAAPSPTPDTGNEVARLGDAFRRMGARVRESLFVAESARAEAVATAAQLRARTHELEEQTQEAQALAEELEQQVEQAQALSEQVEQSNRDLLQSVTAANDARAQAEAARADAEVANRAKADFLASMSHELRTPLNAIGGFVDLLEMEVAGPVAGAQREYLARVKRAQDLLLRRIDDMLNFAKVESGSLTYTMRRVPIHDALTAVAALLEPLMTQRGLAFECSPPDAAASVRADREKLDQILLNLLSNAMKFTNPGGRVVLSSHSYADHVEVRVSDTGVGIPAEKLSIIFEPFVQLESSLTRQREGTGLGLAISQQLARAMGGEICVTSTLGAGSTFTLVLPLGGSEMSVTPGTISDAVVSAGASEPLTRRRATPTVG